MNFGKQETDGKVVVVGHAHVDQQLSTLSVPKVLSHMANTFYTSPSRDKRPAFAKATMTALKDATLSTSGSQLLHIVLPISDHYVKG